MVFVRGRILPEVGSAGRVTRSLGILLDLKELRRGDLTCLDELEQLRIYLGSLDVCVSIKLFCQQGHSQTRLALLGMGIECETVPDSEDLGKVPQLAAEGLSDSLKALLATALECNADCIVTSDVGALPYIEEFYEAGVLLTSSEFVLRYAEAFARGHDVPWSFARKVWFEPWMAFYQLSEQWIFDPTLHFLTFCQSKGADREAMELGRSLVYNRLGHLCFTRDRLWFYEIQQAMAKRAGWKRQRFAHEVAYYLNFYYLLLFGMFDHTAVFVNALFKLGLNERQVSARNPEFLRILRSKSPSVGAVFEKPGYVEFIKRIAAVRHTAAHRGILTPTKVVEDLDHPPTDDELDRDIRDAGLEDLIQDIPSGPSRVSFRGMLRSNARAARYERKTLMEDVVLIEIDGKHFFIHPLNDTWWNFKRCFSFLEDVFRECAKALP